MLPAIKVDPQDKKADKSKEAPPWLQIESEHWSYVAQAIDGQYPNWRQVVPTDTNGWTTIVLQTKAVDTILDAIPLLPGNEDVNRGVTLLAGNGLALRAKGKDQSDWTTINVPDASVTGKAVELCLNRAFLLQALRFGLNKIEIHDSLEPVIFRDQGRMIIVMPLRLDGPVEPPPAPKTEPSQTENAPAAPPSAPEAQTQTATTPVSATATTAPERGNSRANTNGANGNEENGESRSTFKSALEQIDRIKTNLRDVMGDLNDAVTMLKNAEKEQRASAKEIQTVRAKLREIQSVEI